MKAAEIDTIEAPLPGNDREIGIRLCGSVVWYLSGE